MSAGIGAAETMAGTGRRQGAPDERIRVAVVGATGYAGAELVRILARHPAVELVGLAGRGRSAEPVETVHPHLATTGLAIDEAVPEADAVFLALPHGIAVGQVPAIVESGATVIDLGPDFRLRDAADYPRWYGFEHRPPGSAGAGRLRAAGAPPGRADRPVAASPSGSSARRAAIATATILALAPLARAGLIGDLVVDAKSGVSGAGRDTKPDRCSAR